MDLSRLSNADLEAVAAGRMQDVSDAGLRIIAGKETPLQAVGGAVDTALKLEKPDNRLAMLEAARSLLAALLLLIRICLGN